MKKKSRAIFQVFGEVEAKIHGVGIEDIHFHELGAVDSIIDIIGTVFALEVLGIEHLYSSPLPDRKREYFRCPWYFTGPRSGDTAAYCSR